MELSLDTLKETFFDYNSDTLLDIYDNVKSKAFHNGLMLNSKSQSFVNIILKNVYFAYDYSDDDDEFINE